MSLLLPALSALISVRICKDRLGLSTVHQGSNVGMSVSECVCVCVCMYVCLVCVYDRLYYVCFGVCVCVYVCSAGAGRTGTFCALSTVLERVKAEGILDVFQTVKSLRLQRPHMVQTLVSTSTNHSAPP